VSDVSRARGHRADLTPRVVDVVAWWLSCVPDEVEFLRGYSRRTSARANHFVFARDRQRFMVGRGRLRQVLDELSGYPPGAIRFASTWLTRTNSSEPGRRVAAVGAVV
jgi:hypothetical protein